MGLGMFGLDLRVISGIRLIKVERKFTLGQFLKKNITKQLWVRLSVWRTEILVSILVMLRCTLGEGGYIVVEGSLTKLSTSKLLLSTCFFQQMCLAVICLLTCGCNCCL